MVTSRFVPDDFEVPEALDTGQFRLRPLGVEHNESDYEAWHNSIEHIRRTPGFRGRRWPVAEMTVEENREDLARHARDFRERTGFTYTVLAPDDETVIGCVYIYPSDDADSDASVRSWVRASHAGLDADLYRTVSEWLQDRWPFERIDPRPRADGSAS